MTSSMLWNEQNANLLTAKDLKTGRVGKTGTIGAICYQFATKTEQVGVRVDCGGSALFRESESALSVPIRGIATQFSKPTFRLGYRRESTGASGN